MLVHECLVVDLNYEVCDFFRVSCSLALCWSGCHTCAKIQVLGSGFCKKTPNDLFVDADENKRGMTDESLCGKQGIRNSRANQGYESEAAL